ncbi:MAG: MarR family transcriptional regulator [bacterium]|nr:MarR family transcriptional regulator [bacterium]
MSQVKIQNIDSLEQEMRAVARGEEPAPEDAAQTSFNSVEALARLLTPENRKLLAIIRDKQPQSIAELATLSGRAAPNLTRTLAKMESAGLIKMKTLNRRKTPTPAIQTIRLEIDPYSQNDRLILT